MRAIPGTILMLTSGAIPGFQDHSRERPNSVYGAFKGSCFSSKQLAQLGENNLRYKGILNSDERGEPKERDPPADPPAEPPAAPARPVAGSRPAATQEAPAAGLQRRGALTRSTVLARDEKIVPNPQVEW